jgi:tol-pal system protein YbgF
MSRHWMLPRARSAMAVFGFLAILGLPAVAWSQDRTEERIDRIERDLNMLQRQVYRGVAPSVMADPGAAADVEIRMDRLEAGMRELTGRVEEFANRVELLRQRIEQINSDLDVRFNQGVGVAAAPPPPPSRRQTAYEPPPAPAPSLPLGTVVPAPIFGTLTPPGSAPPAGAATAPDLPGGTRAAAPGGLLGGTASEQYNYALGLLKQADYAGAEQAMRAFMQAHPEHPKAGAAQYWIGETYFARGRFAEAAAAFAEGYRRYPKGSEAPEELLRLSMALARTKQKDNACVALAQLEREFPNPSVKIKEQAGAEKKRLGC